MVLAGDVRRDHVTLVLADVGQRPDAGDVADRPQPLARPQVLVDLDAVRVDLDADRLQADSLDPRAPPRAHQQLVAAQLACRRRTPARSPRRRAARRLACWPSLSSIPSWRSASLSASPSGAGSRGSTRSAPSTITASPPSRRTTWASLDARRPAAQHQQAPRDGLHAGRLPGAPHARPARQPRDRAARTGPRRSPPRHAPRCAGRRPPPPRPVPASRPVPRSRSMPWSASQRSCPASDQFDTMKSRQASAACTSTCALAPASRAPCTASPGRSSVLDGMHAQYEHSPPTSSRSTTATRSPRAASAAGAVLTGRPAAEDDHVVVVRAHR